MAGVPLLALLLAGAPLAAGRAEARERKPDTAGSSLIKAWTQARRKYSDAVFVSVSARTEAAGEPVCDPRDPFRNGWRYSFYSPAEKKFLMVAECQGVLAGPLTQMRNKNASTLSIVGTFVDSDVALKVLERSNISLDPAEHGAGGRRPFSLTLHRITDDRFETHPVVWKVAIGKKSYLVDAVKNELFSPKSYGVSLRVEKSTEAYAAEILGKRPKRANVYTARRDLDRVINYAQRRFKDVILMGIEGFTDAWGGSPCTGAGDGWAYYFYNARTKAFEAVYACNGQIGPGPSHYIPVDLNLNDPIDRTFLDSSKIMDALIVNNPSIMNEGMGRNFSRNASMLLLHYKTSPIAQAGMWEVRSIWRVTVGRSRIRFDAKTGAYLDSTD